jgi:apolipoprotein D and lipocalin family protein
MKKTILIILTNMIVFSAYPQKVPSVAESVDLKRYQGTWYEIARLPNYFERKLKCITATYIFREDGKITVVNKGNYITSPHKPSSSEGVAWVPDTKSPAKLKVQFFWPFSGDYWIMHLDQDYRYVLVGDPALKYLWILCREKKLDEAIYGILLQKAIDNGYDITSIIRVDHDCD